MQRQQAFTTYQEVPLSQIVVPAAAPVRSMANNGTWTRIARLVRQ